MIPNSFDYAAPENLETAVALLQQNRTARPLAGGQSLLTELKLRQSSPSLVVDLSRIGALQGIEHSEQNEGLRIGAMTRLVAIAANREVKENYRVLAEAIGQIGDSQVRNWGTLGGNLAGAEPGLDLPPVVLVFEAKIEVTGMDGKRVIPADAFFVGKSQTALEPGEIISAVEFPATNPGTGSAYEKMKNPATCHAVCGVAVRITREPNGNINTCRVAITGAVNHPMRLRQVEAALEGKKDAARNISAAAELASQGLVGVSDRFASAKYRAYLATVLTERALKRALERANAR